MDDLLPTEVEGFDSLAELAQDMRWSWNHYGDKKIGHDAMRCMMEARLENRQPIAVTHQAESMGQAIDGAADKLTRLIEHTLGRLHHHKSRRTTIDEKSGLYVRDA